MDKRKPELEWLVLENKQDRQDAQWTMPAGAPAAPNTDKEFFPPWLPAGLGLMLLLIAIVAGWMWQSARPEQARMEGELRSAAQQELWPSTENRRDGAANLTGTVGSNSQLAADLEIVDMQGDRAVVRMISAADSQGQTYRQTLFFRFTEQGWVRTAPDPALWGAPQRLETAHFDFRFRQMDGPAVAAAAPRLDLLYETVQRNFGLHDAPDTGKWMIQVGVAQAPSSEPLRLPLDAGFLVASPALYRAPAELSDSDLLAQSVALPLIDQMVAQAAMRHTRSIRWQPLVNGLRLWQVWHTDLPLSAWREELVTWLYVGRAVVTSGQPVVLPDHYVQLCMVHQLWMAAPAQIQIPLLCAAQDQADWYLAGWIARPPPFRLAQLTPPLPPGAETGERYWPSHPGEVVALATLVEYAVAAYGQERLPKLVAGLGKYDSWETLVPALFGVSTGEFEAGWQTWLVDQYSYNTK
jgi:hypothetical protein